MPLPAPAGHPVPNLASSATWHRYFINMHIWHLLCTFHPQLSERLPNFN